MFVSLFIDDFFLPGFEREDKVVYFPLTPWLSVPRDADGGCWLVSHCVHCSFGWVFGVLSTFLCVIHLKSGMCSKLPPTAGEVSSRITVQCVSLVVYCRKFLFYRQTPLESFYREICGDRRSWPITWIGQSVCRVQKFIHSFIYVVDCKYFFLLIRSCFAFLWFHFIWLFWPVSAVRVPSHIDQSTQCSPNWSATDCETYSYYPESYSVYSMHSVYSTYTMYSVYSVYSMHSVYSTYTMYSVYSVYSDVL